MKLRIFIIVFLISTFAFTESPKAIFVSNTYKQGIYNISESKEFLATAKLIKNPPTTFIIIDSNGNQKYFKKFDNFEETINLGYIRDGDLIIVAGNGEIAVSRS
ncbi:hypothetical protein NNC19_12820 [Clostridium sp. SHJSY1]|uniref:hypothetical protein n=1 Tax=Clostridium sp. SHJSY1 TaxID=2942483 RepID=UPI002876DC06|nr:hypothetical protein [Clostridium sp. SHJSY1]MDS0526567.1 hypothetical protein [Clostridium sp. SHJSY1]